MPPPPESDSDGAADTDIDEETIEIVDAIGTWLDTDLPAVERGFRLQIRLGRERIDAEADPAAEEIGFGETEVQLLAPETEACREAHELPAEASFDFKGESDALIVRGIIAVLKALYAGVPVQIDVVSDGQ